MKVIVISTEPYLSGFLKYANPNLNIAAIVTPMYEMVKAEDAKFDDGRNFKLYNYCYLKECLEEIIDYDYIIVGAPSWSVLEDTIIDDLTVLKVDRNKIFKIGLIYLKNILEYHSMIDWIEEDISKYKILITGVSHAFSRGTDTDCYELGALNCAMPSQDLYYSYQWAKKIFSMKNANFKYEILEVSPFSFHSDESAGGGGVKGTTNGDYCITIYFLKMFIIFALLKRLSKKFSVKNF